MSDNLPANPDQMSATPQTGQKSHVMITHAEITGPLPQASECKGYEDVLPGAADRILKMAEDEAKDRRGKDEQGLKAAIRAGTRGQWLAFATVALSLGVMALCLLLDKPIGSIPSGLVALGTLIPTLINSKHEK
jgi:uncharacterized membrane protein